MELKHDKKTKQISVISVVFSLIIALLVFTFFFNNGRDSPIFDAQRINLYRQVNNPSFINDLVVPLSEAELEEIYGGYGFLVWSDIERPLDVDNPNGYFGEMTLETPQDLMTANITNGFETPLNFIVKVFYNYEDVAFRVLGAETYETEFLVSVPSDHQVDIAFQLDERLEVNDTINKLTVGIFLAPEQYALFNEELASHFAPASVLNFEINYGVEGELILPIEPSTPLLLVEKEGIHSLTINQDFTPNDNDFNGASPPPEHLQVSPGEEIELGFVTNATAFTNEELNSHLIISLLDWYQIPMNGEPYLFTKAESNVDVGQHRRFSITAPDEPGFYEFVSFIVPNPTNRNSQDNFFLLERSLRFTIEVLE